MTCDKCKISVYRARFVAGEWIGVDCGCVKDRAVRSAVNLFGDLTLQHIHGEDGKPIRVTSINQLREAEQRYGFKHHLANQSSEHFDIPPTHRPQTVLDRYERKFRGHA